MGPGFNERSASDVRKQMGKLVIAKPAVDTGRKRNAVLVDLGNSGMDHISDCESGMRCRGYRDEIAR
ncbi:hypothetical protein IE4771_CH00821 [Rhizobium etli bv. mimosae str. IE4771]|uniref:Uncharacterized protein n=1 Tax=Rhizobium etli bv. mimosae str. IE4771 TaxID=1432050 RepID=A0A060I3B7_RHIET|nr:hypothetical protein IE4771_CH00821 [Rhizobium sp. IE4771]